MTGWCIVLPLIYDSVTNNNDAAVREMLEYLKGQGFAYVVFVMRPGEGISTRTARRQAVERYCDDLGLGGEVLVYDDGIDGLRSRIANLLELCGDRKACLFANNDESMRDILEATSAGLRRRVGVCSFADEHWAKYSGPGITCLDQEPMLMGRRAAQKLFARIYDGSEEPCSLDEVPARLCIFASTEI